MYISHLRAVAGIPPHDGQVRRPPKIPRDVAQVVVVIPDMQRAVAQVFHRNDVVLQQYEKAGHGDHRQVAGHRQTSTRNTTALDDDSSALNNTTSTVVRSKLK